MPNTDVISSIVTKEAFQQMQKLNNVLDSSLGKFNDVAAAADNYSRQLGKSKTLRELTDNTKLLADVNLKLKKELVEVAKADKLRREQELLLMKTERERLAIEREAEQAAEKKAKAQQKNVKLTLEEKVALQEKTAAEKAAIREANAAIGSLERKRLELTRLQKAYDKLGAAEVNSSKGKELLSKIQALDVEVKKLEADTGRFQRNVGNYGSVWDRFGDKGLGAIKKIGNGFDNLFRTAAAGFIGFFSAQGLSNLFGGVGETVKKFDQSVADLKAITGVAGKDLEFLKKQAIDTGKGVVGGASAVVEAYKLIASAKPELLNNAQALDTVTRAAITLSKASGDELPVAATALTDALNQFAAPAEEADRYINALAAGAKFGSAEVPQLTEALLKFGAASRTNNVSIEESVGLIETLAEKGLKGAEAGTAIRNILLKISAPEVLPKRAQEALNSLGISFDGLRDKSKPLADRLQLLTPLLKDSGKLTEVFGLENVIAATNVLQNTDRLKELTKQVTGTNTAMEQASDRTKTVSQAANTLKESWNSLILSTNDATGASGKLSAVLLFVANNLPGIIKSVLVLGSAWLLYRGYVLAATAVTNLKNVALIANAVATNQATKTTLLNITMTNAEGTAVKANTILVYLMIAAKKAWSFATKLLTYEIKLFNGAIKTSPIGIFLTVLGVGIALFGSLSASANNAANSIKVAAQAQRELSEATLEGKKNAILEISALERKYTAATTAAIGIDKQRAAAIELQKTYPATFANFTVEEIMLGKAQKAYESLSKSILANSILKAKQSLLDKNALSFAEEEEKILRKIDQIDEQTISKRVAIKKDPNYNNRLAPLAPGLADEYAKKGIKRETIGERDLRFLADEKAILQKQRDQLQENFKLRNKIFTDAIAKEEINAEEYNKNFAAKVQAQNKSIIENTNTGSTGNPETDAEKKARKQREKDAAKDAKDAQKRAEDYAKVLAKLDEDELKAKTQVEQEKYELVTANLQRIVDDEKASVQTRLTANSLLYTAKEQAALKAGKAEEDAITAAAIKDAQAAVDRELTADELMQVLEGTANQRLAIEASTTNKVNEIRTEGLKKQQDITEAFLKENLETLRKNGEKRLTQIDADEAKELTAVADKYSKGEINAEQYEKDRAEIQERYALKRLNLELQIAEGILAASKLAGIDTVEAEKKIADLKLKIAETAADKLDKQKKKDIEKDKEYSQRKKEIYEELGKQVATTIFDFLDAGIEKQKQGLEKEKQIIDERRNAEVERINTLAISEEEKAARIQILDAQTQSNKEKIDKKQRELERKKAILDKARAIAEITINTAAAIMKNNAQLGFVAAVPINILTGVLSALQIASVIAAPLPQYWEGTDDAVGGPSIVGEIGKELVITPEGRLMETPSRPTIMDIPKHSIVIPNNEYMHLLGNHRNNSVLAMPQLSVNQSGMMDQGIAERLDRIVAAIAKQPQVVNNFSTLGISSAVKKGHSWNEYVDKYIRHKKP